MSRQGGMLVIVAASALVACASNGPEVSVSGTVAPARARPPAAAAAPTAVAAPVAAPVPTAASSVSEAALNGKYRRVVKNGTEYFCRKEPVTGSRVQLVETCLTEKQLAAQVEANQDVMRRMQNGPREAPPQHDDPTLILTN